MPHARGRHGLLGVGPSERRRVAFPLACEPVTKPAQPAELGILFLQPRAPPFSLILRVPVGERENVLSVEGVSRSCVSAEDMVINPSFLGGVSQELSVAQPRQLRGNTRY